MRAMALAALQGGADAIRADGPQDIRAIRAVCDQPLIGLYKDWREGWEVYITPTLEHAREIVTAGALLEQLLSATDKPVIGEGRFWTPEDVRRGFDIGAHGIVVGTAITNPREVTKRFKRISL